MHQICFCLLSASISQTCSAGHQHNPNTDIRTHFGGANQSLCASANLLLPSRLLSTRSHDPATIPAPPPLNAHTRPGWHLDVTPYWADLMDDILSAGDSLLQLYDPNNSGSIVYWDKTLRPHIGEDKLFFLGYRIECLRPSLRLDPRVSH